MLLLLQTSGLIEPRIHITNGSRPTRDVDVRYIITRVSLSLDCVAAIRMITLSWPAVG